MDKGLSEKERYTGRNRYMVTMLLGVERQIFANAEDEAKRKGEILTGLRAVKAEEY